MKRKNETFVKSGNSLCGDDVKIDEIIALCDAKQQARRLTEQNFAQYVICLMEYKKWGESEFAEHTHLNAKHYYL